MDFASFNWSSWSPYHSSNVWRYTALGGTADVAGKTVVGAQNIFFAQLADPNHHGLFTYGTRFFAGRFATMMFGLQVQL